MIARACVRLLALSLPALMLAAIFSASASTNSIDRSRIGNMSLSVSANDLKPPQCAAQHVDRLIVGTGVISGTSGNDLILGGSGADVISGEGGNDCIVGGAGDDTLIGGAGNDACVGGPGVDIIDASCEH